MPTANIIDPSTNLSLFQTHDAGFMTTPALGVLFGYQDSLFQIFVQPWSNSVGARPDCHASWTAHLPIYLLNERPMSFIRPACSLCFRKLTHYANITIFPFRLPFSLSFPIVLSIS